MNILRWLTVASTAAAIAFFSGAGMAQDRDGGLYASLGGFFVIPRDNAISVDVDEHEVTFDVSMKSGLGAVAAVGYSLPSGFQAELELGYRRFDFDEVMQVAVSGPVTNGRADASGSVDGNFSTLSIMANGLYSFRRGKFRPYGGLGLGIAQHTVEFSRISVMVGDERFSFEGHDSESATAFAYQGMVGIGYALSDNAEVRLGYRYFATADADFEGVEMTYGTHNIEAGVVFRF